MLIFEYSPYKILNKKEYAMVDAYYFVSNSSYHKAKELADDLSKLDFNAEYRFDLNYKKLAIETDFCGFGINTLCYLKGLGSHFVMQAVEVEGEFEHSSVSLKINLNCDECLKCQTKCPTGAISKDFFDYKKCLRHLQENPEQITLEQAKKMQNKMLGCDLCQAVCPYNKEQLRVDMPVALKELLKLEILLDILKSSKKTKEILTPLIGANYAKVKILLPMALIAAGNSGNINLMKKIEFFKDYNNELVRKNANYAINNLLKDKKL